MSEYRTEGDFEISVDELWAVVRNFGDVGWLPGDPKFESKGEGVGMTRTINTPPFPIVTEVLDAIDEGERAVHYRVIKGNPMPVEDYRAKMKVVDLGDGRSRLEWSSTWTPKDVTEDEAHTFVGKMYNGVLKVMKKNLERGWKPTS